MSSAFLPGKSNEEGNGEDYDEDGDDEFDDDSKDETYDPNESAWRQEDKEEAILDVKDLEKRTNSKPNIQLLEAMTNRWDALGLRFKGAGYDVETWAHHDSRPFPWNDDTRLLFPVIHNLQQQHNHNCRLCLLKQAFRHCVSLAQWTNQKSHGMTTWAQVDLFASVPQPITEIPAVDSKKRNFAQLSALEDDIPRVTENGVVYDLITAKMEEAQEAIAQANAQLEEAEKYTQISKEAKEVASAAETAKQAACDANQAKLTAEQGNLEGSTTVGTTGVDGFDWQAEFLKERALRLTSEAGRLASEAGRLASEAGRLTSEAGRLTSDAGKSQEVAKRLAGEAFKSAQQILVDSARNTYDYVLRIESSCKLTNGVLLHLGTLGNETAKDTQESSVVDTSRLGSPLDADSMRQAHTIIENPGQLDLAKFVHAEPMETSIESELDQLYKCLNDGFLNATLAGSKTLEADIETTVRAIHHWREGITSAFFVPGDAFEENGWQPILNAITYEIDTIVNGDPTITIQQKISGSTWFADRRADIGVSHSSEHLRAILPFMSTCIIEVKPLSRQGVSLRRLHNEGAHQIIGHLSKQLHYNFHFGELGVDSTCTASVLTLASIEIIEMELSKLGTSDIHIDLRKSGIHGLFDEKTNAHLFRLIRISKQRKKNEKKAAGDLVGKKPAAKKQFVAQPQVAKESFVDQVFKRAAARRQGVAKRSSHDHGVKKIFPKTHYMKPGGRSEGFHAIAKLLHDAKKENDIFTSKGRIFRVMPSGAEQELEKKDHAGSGMFGSVYKVNDKLVIKLPKSYRANHSLRRENETLCLLDHPCIPKVDSGDKAWCTVAFYTRCERAEFMGLLIHGIVGEAATTIERNNLAALDAIHRDVRSALQHAHERGFSHLDVRPKNIIYVSNGKGSYRAQLIDWGCASRLGSQLPGFRGSLPFAHDEMLLEKATKGELTAKPDFDWASLSFTVAALLNGNNGHPPWWGFYKRNLISAYLRRRYKQALPLIENSGLMATAQLKQALPLPDRSDKSIDDAARKLQETVSSPQEANIEVPPEHEDTILPPVPQEEAIPSPRPPFGDDDDDAVPLLSQGGSTSVDSVSSQDL